MSDSTDSVGISRRTAFQGLGAFGVALALAGCSGSDDGAGGGDAPPEVEQGKVLATTDEVPVGGGLVLGDEAVVITQPTKGTFHAFSAHCTHQGTLVDEVTKTTIHCPLHGSEFSPKDGSVVTGPATEPLPTVEIEVDGTDIRAA